MFKHSAWYLYIFYLTYLVRWPGL